MKRPSKASGKSAKHGRIAALKPKRASAQSRKSLPTSSAAGAPGEIARLTRELNEALERQAATSQVLEVISGSPGDLQAVFVAVLENAVRLCDANFGMFWQCEGKGFRCVALHNAPSAFSDDLQKQPVVYPPPGSGLRILAETRKVIHVADLAAMPTYTQQRVPAIVAAVELGGVRTYVAVPMLKNNELIGALIVYRQEVRRFSERQIDLVKNFAAQAVIALDNARLLNELRQRTTDLTEALEQQTATSDVLQVISSSPGDLEPVFTTMLENAARICEAKFGNVYLWDGDAFHLVAAHNTPSAFAESRKRGPFRPNTSHPFRGLVETKEVFHVADVAALPGYKGRDPQIVEPVELGGIRTCLGVPMLKDNSLIGALVIFRQEVRPFTDKQIQLIKNFAAQAVIAIENARLLTELRELLAQQTATADVLKAISSSAFDLRIVLDTLVKSAAMLCEADMASINRPSDGKFLQIASYSYSTEFNEFMAQHSIPTGRGSVAGRAVAERRAVQIADVQSDPEYEFKEGAKLGGLHTMLGVPLLREGTPIGVLALSRKNCSSLHRQADRTGPNFCGSGRHRHGKCAVARTNCASARSDLTESLEQQTATSEVLQVISGSPGELDTVFAAILSSSTRICEAQLGNLFLREGDTLRAVAWHGERLYAEDLQPDPLIIKTDRPDIPLARLAATKRRVHIPDLTRDAAYAAGFAPLVALVDRGGARTLLIVPMLKEDTLLGAIAIYRQEVRPFSDKQIALVENFAAQAVIAIENARLLNELRQRTDDLSKRTSDLTEALEQQTATSEVLKVISSSPGDLQPVFDAMLGNAVRLCDAQFGILSLYEGGPIRIGAMHDMPLVFAERFQREPIVNAGPLAPISRLVATKDIVHVVDLTKDPAYEQRDPPVVALAEIGGVRSLLAVPMLKDRELVGALNIYRQEVRPFADKQIDLVKNFAAQAVIAIENTRLLNELRESLQQQTATGEILSSMSGSIADTKPVFDAIVRNLLRLFGTRFATIQLLQNGMIYLPAVAGEPGFERLAEFFPRPLSDESFSGRAMLLKEPFQFAPLVDNPAVPPFGQETAREFGYNSIVFAPMIREDKVIGAIGTAHREAKPFSEQQVALLKSFADQAVIAIENATLLHALRQRTDDLTRSLEDLRTTQDRLVQTQKLASLGQLTAGIAHEIKNPLNFVNNFSGVSAELIDELREALAGVKADEKTRAEITELADTLRDNLDKIVQHGKRADAIVKNMLLHSREGSGEHRPVDINALVDESRQSRLSWRPCREAGFQHHTGALLRPCRR